MFSLAALLRSLIPFRSSDYRRRYRRYRHVTFVLVQPLNADLRPAGPMSWGMTSDISKQGIGLATEKLVKSEYIRVHIREDNILLLAEVKHRRLDTSIGERLRFQIGAEILGDSDHTYRMGLY